MFLINLVFFLAFIIAVLSARCSFYITSRTTCTSMLVITVALLYDYLWFKCSLLLLYGDIELNPEPRQNTTKNFSICSWNLNSILAYNFAKLVLLKAYNLINRFEIICLSETYLHSNILPDDNNLEFPGYNLERSDQLSRKKAGVFVYITKVIYL